MEPRKERMVNESKKIVDNINAMSFEHLNDEQVHSLMMIREMARGIIQNRVDRVSCQTEIRQYIFYVIFIYLLLYFQFLFLF